MRRVLSCCCLLLLLSGCSREDRDLAAVMKLREQLLQAEKCLFQAEISADYGQQIHQFCVSCDADRDGTVHFSVTAPESISGITGELSASGGRLKFDSAVLGFPLLGDGTLSPVSAPWVFLNSLRSGYLSACGETGDGVRVTVFDSYAEDALQLDIWLDEEFLPYYGEFFWRGQRVLSLKIDNFEIL